MRFAYIDSQGNEVPIPGVDALALRIQLGAVAPETELYDAQADRWGPARSHEIFLTLARETEQQGFVAPPPPVRAPRPASDGVAASAGSSRSGGGSGAAAALREEGDDGDPSDEASELQFDFTPLDPASEGAPSRLDPDAAGDEPPEAEGPLAFDLADDLAGGGAASPSLAPARPSPGADGPGAGRDESGAADEPWGGEGALDPDDLEAEGVLEFHGEMELGLSDGAPDAPSPGRGGDDGGALDLEPPLSEFEAGSPPLWMEQDGPARGGEDAILEFGPGPEETPTEPEVVGTAPSVARQPRGAPRPPGPRARPSPPRRPQRRSSGGLVAAAVALVVLGVGGWFGWQRLQGGAAAESRLPELPDVTIPAIPAELLPTFRDVGEAALSGMLADLEAFATQSGLPAEPRQDWLSGSYLANAGQYADVVAYWEGLEGFVERVRAAEAGLFHENYEAELAARGIAADTAAILLERADSGFLATRRERWEAYLQMEDLVDASLGLHDFLRANEGEIDYEPAAGGMSADPVLEAVPATRELGNEMWSRVDQITEALDRLGTLDRVTTERLTAVLLDRIRRAGFQ